MENHGAYQQKGVRKDCVGDFGEGSRTWLSFLDWAFSEIGVFGYSRF